MGTVLKVIRSDGENVYKDVKYYHYYVEDDFGYKVKVSSTCPLPVGEFVPFKIRSFKGSLEKCLKVDYEALNGDIK